VLLLLELEELGEPGAETGFEGGGGNISDANGGSREAAGVLAAYANVSLVSIWHSKRLT